MAAGDPARRADGLPERAVQQHGLLPVGREAARPRDSASACATSACCIAELQRINSHLVWLGTHGMEVGAVSVMLYCFRERELLLNINEMLAGFRMFPSYMRVGGLREDLPRGFHDAVRAFLDRFRPKLDEYEDLLTKNEIYLKRTQGVGVISKDDAVAYGLVGPIARAAGVDYDVRKVFPVSRLRDLRLRGADADRRRRLRALSGARRRDAREREDLPPGARADHADRRLRDRRSAHHAAAQGSRLHRDGSADSALPDLLAGLHGAGRRGLRAGRRAARRAGLLRRLGRHQPAVARSSRARRRCWRARRSSR